MRLVLDTNVWIDWLVFDDPSITPLRAAHQDGRIQIVLDEACLDELKKVLAYQQFNLAPAQRESNLAKVGSLVVKPGIQPVTGSAALPRCRDPDDQKFVTLAFYSSARWLLTRDKALLVLNRRLKTKGIRVGTPMEWSASMH